MNWIPPVCTLDNITESNDSVQIELNATSVLGAVLYLLAPVGCFGIAPLFAAYLAVRDGQLGFLAILLALVPLLVFMFIQLTIEVFGTFRVWIDSRGLHRETRLDRFRLLIRPSKPLIASMDRLIGILPDPKRLTLIVFRTDNVPASRLLLFQIQAQASERFCAAANRIIDQFNPEAAALRAVLENPNAAYPVSEHLLKALSSRVIKTQESMSTGTYPNLIWRLHKTEVGWRVAEQRVRSPFVLAAWGLLVLTDLALAALWLQPGWFAAEELLKNLPETCRLGKIVAVFTAITIFLPIFHEFLIGLRVRSWTATDLLLTFRRASSVGFFGGIFGSSQTIDLSRLKSFTLTVSRTPETVYPWTLNLKDEDQALLASFEHLPFDIAVFLANGCFVQSLSRRTVS